MVLQGIAQRATVRAALGAAVVAALCAVAGQLVPIIAIGTVAHWGGGWIPLGLTALSALLQTAALLALLRKTGRLTPGRFAPLLIAAAAAWALAFLCAWSWSVGFDRADAGLIPTPFTAGLGVFALCAWLLGGVVVAAVVAELGGSLPRGLRAAAAVVAGAVVPLALGPFAVFPAAGVLSSLVIIVFCVRTAPSGADPAPALTPRHTVAAPLSRRGGVVALACAVVGTAAVLFAFLGSGIVVGIDGTRAMQIGLAAGALSGIPLLGIAASRLAARCPAHRLAIGGAIALLIIGVALDAAYALSGAGADGDLPWAALLPAAAGIGLLTWAHVRGSRGLRLMLAATASAAAFLPLWLALTAAGLLVPPIALIVGVRAVAAGRRRGQVAATFGVRYP